MKKIVILLFLLGTFTGVYSQLKRSFQRVGEKEKIIYDSLSLEIEKYPDSAELYFERANSVLLLNANRRGKDIIDISDENILNDLIKAIRLNNNIPDFYKTLSDYQRYIADNLDSAIYYIEKAIQLEPENPKWLYRSGFLKYKKEDFTGACEDWLKGAAFSGDDAEMCKKMLNRCD